MTKKGTNTSKKIKISLYSYVPRYSSPLPPSFLPLFLRETFFYFSLSVSSPFNRRSPLVSPLARGTDAPFLPNYENYEKCNPLLSRKLGVFPRPGRSKVSTRASRTRRWQISSPPVFPYPFEFPSRNKKENAAEIIFVSKESAFLLHFPRVLTHNRKTEREEHRQTQTRAETRSSSNRTNETQQQQRLFDNTRDGRGDVSGRLSICPFNSTSRQSRKRVTLITSLPAWPLVASSGSSVVHSCTSPRRLHIYIYTTREHRARGKYLRKFP